MTAVCPRCGANASGGLSVCATCWLNDDGGATEPPLELPGLVLEQEIGRGGMGRVFRARHVRLERTVAVKVLSGELAALPEFAARFEREARALARLSHPHIVAVHDFGTTPNGVSYLIMEYMPAGALSRRIPLPIERAIEVALEICEGLRAAHEGGIVHRDIKPDNVLFDRAGRAKIADFGIARLLEQEGADALTHPAFVAGTPAYMAPEARRGAPADPRMDVYAMGVLLVNMVTGSATGQTGSAELDQLVLRATAPQAERIPSARALSEALRSLKQRVTHAALSDALPPEEQSWQKASALAFAAASAVGLFALVTSLTPRVLHQNDALPLIVFGTRPLPDGRVFTVARFETWPTLAAGAAFSVALASYGLLRRHWREAGLERTEPDRPIDTSKHVLYLALALDAAFLLHLGFERTLFGAAGPYLPVFGGMFEFVLLYWVWLTALEAIRRGRPLRRESRLWVGLVLGLVPPGFSFLRSLLPVV